MQKESAQITTRFPLDWSECSLRELETLGILIIKNGFSCGTHEINGQGVPHLRPFNVTEDGRLAFEQIKTIPYRQGMEDYSLRDRDILYNNTNSEELVGKCAYWTGRQGLNVLSNHMTIMRITDPEGIDPHFLALYLFWFWVTGSARLICRRHVNQASIGLERMRQIAIPHPPLFEQRAISTVLSKIQSAVEVQDKIIAKLKELKAATMAKLFREGLRGEPLKQTEIGETPESWDVVLLGSIYERMNYGTSVHCKTDEEGRPVLRIPNIINEMVNSKDLKYVNLPLRETEKLLLADGDLLFVRTNGNKQYTGRCAVYQGVPDEALFASYLIRVRLAKGTVTPSFTQAFLSSVGREQITSKASPAADGKFNIDTGVLKSLMIPRPSSSEQEEITKALQAIEVRLQKAQERKRIVDQLFYSMLHLLMTGQIRVTESMSEWT